MPEFTCLRDKESKCLSYCAIYDPEKVLTGSEDLRNEHWTGGTNGKQEYVEVESWIFFQKRQKLQEVAENQ
jgi:hypothetical protein